MMASSPVANSEVIPTLKAIEFFSGIGGWARALEQIEGVHVKICRAYDVNPAAATTYKSNFKTDVSPRSIVNITEKELSDLHADLWVMSPPCQPFTRNNETACRDKADTRSEALVHLMEILSTMQTPPRFLALENVVGFESSDCCTQLLQMLDSRGYKIEQFILSPPQFCIPNDRPRYYLLAKRVPLLSSSSTTLGIIRDIPLVDCESSSTSGLLDYLDSNISETTLADFVISDSVLEKPSSWCFDVVLPSSKGTACFTKSYTRYTKGTGSVLLIDNDEDVEPKKRIRSSIGDLSNGIAATASSKENFHSESEEAKEFLSLLSTDPSTREYDLNWTRELRMRGKRLRYFTPNELLRLFGFNPPLSKPLKCPHLFVFPEEIALRKQYELIGNSLNVDVVRHLLHRLLV